MKRILLFMALLSCAGCSGNENAHTTTTTVVPPPPRQVLRAELREAPDFPVQWNAFSGKNYERFKPILVFDLKDGAEFREGQPVVIDFTVVSGKLKGDGGDYRLRYMVDDDDMQWVDREGQIWLWGWLPGKHTIRLELIGPDGWPYRNGDLNVESREITIVK